jgi:hypothetical protein
VRLSRSDFLIPASERNRQRGERRERKTIGGARVMGRHKTDGTVRPSFKNRRRWNITVECEFTIANFHLGAFETCPSAGR